jgi:hypothetical protein
MNPTVLLKFFENPRPEVLLHILNITQNTAQTLVLSSFFQAEFGHHRYSYSRGTEVLPTTGT